MRRIHRVFTCAKRGFQAGAGVLAELWLIRGCSAPAAPQRGRSVPSHCPICSGGTGVRLRGHPEALSASGGGCRGDAAASA